MAHSLLSRSGAVGLGIEAATSEKNLSEAKKSCYNYLQSLLVHGSFRPLKTETTMLGVVALPCWPTGLPDYSAFSNIQTSDPWTY